MSFGAGGLEGLEDVASKGISLPEARLSHKKDYHQCQRTLCLQDLRQLGLLDACTASVHSYPATPA